MTVKNGGKRDEGSPNRKVGRPVLDPKDPLYDDKGQPIVAFPNLPPEALALAQSDPEKFNRMYPLKLHDLGMLRGV